MTALERLIDEHRVLALERAWYVHAAWETKARAEIKAVAESARRSLGQKFRYLAARLAAQRSS